MSRHFDHVIVGAGIAGAILARYLGEAGHRVLVLDAGTGEAGDPATYDKLVRNFYSQIAKVPNSPYPANPDAPSPSVLDIGQDVMALAKGGWYVPDPLPADGKLVQWFGSDYLRMTGGTTLHWLGTCLRMLRSDFEMETLYGRGVNWPIRYGDLIDDYGRAEWEIGVSADVKEQEYLGIRFPPGYDYPMRGIPATVVSRVLGARVNGMKVRMGDTEQEVRIIQTPQGRNSTPRDGYTPRGRVRIVRYEDHRRAGEHGRPRAALQAGPDGNARAYFDHLGERCEGNSSCIPICPVQAKYNALKTMAWALRTGNVEVWPRHVVTRVLFGDDGRVTGLVYKRYPDEGRPAETLPVTAGTYILALNAIENAKLMLASYEEDPRFHDLKSTSLMGKNLMDHPFVMTWGEAQEPLGTYRGPSSTAGIETLRDGAFRSQFAAFRIEVGNWGWDLPNGDPYTTAFQLISGQGGEAPVFGAALREQLAHRMQRQVRLGALIEQLPDPKNRVEVRREWKSELGEYRPVIHYGFTDYEIESFDWYRRVSAQVFAQAGVVDRTDWKSPYLAGQRIVRDGKPVGDYRWMGAGHLVGTHRMGATRDKGVVDSYQRSFDHPNLLLTGAGSMCTIGTSNPTLTVAALAFRTLGHLLAETGQSRVLSGIVGAGRQEVAS
jgi:choline dehydrogenase-like flavoprotein